MSTFITGFRPPDSEWKLRKEAFDACRKANIEPPEELWKFFNHDPPDDSGVKVEIDFVEKIESDDADIYQVEVQKLIDMGLKYIRFENSW